MALQTLREIALQKAKKQPKQIDHLTEETPFLDQMPFAASTHGLWHNVEITDHNDAIGFVQMDAPLPNVSGYSHMARINLAKMGAMQEVPEDTARQMGGHAKYFASKEAGILKTTGMNTERCFLYDNFRGYALNKKTNVHDAKGTGKLWSILGVRFEDGVCSGLHNPEGFGNGTLFDILPINGGNVYKNDKGVLVYGVRYKMDLGCMIEGDRSVGTIVNISEDKLPTATMIDDLLSDIRATDSGRTMLVMHHRVLNRIMDKHKDSKVRMRPEDKNINRQLLSWNGIPIITTYQMADGTEDAVVI